MNLSLNIFFNVDKLYRFYEWLMNGRLFMYLDIIDLMMLSHMRTHKVYIIILSIHLKQGFKFIVVFLNKFHLLCFG